MQLSNTKRPHTSAMLRIPLILLAGLLALIVTAGCSMASADPIPAGPVQSAPAVGEVSGPAQTPDVMAGAEIYAANCAACHGATGDGLGTAGQELIEQGVEMPDVSTVQAIEAKSPRTWYNVITTGTMMTGGMMPPWGSTLTDAERWDVAYYMYTLSLTLEEQARGLELYDMLTNSCDLAIDDPAGASPAEVEAALKACAPGHVGDEEITLAALAFFNPSGEVVAPVDAPAVAEEPAAEAEAPAEEAAEAPADDAAAEGATDAAAEEAAVNPDDQIIEPGSVSGVVAFGAEGTAPPEPVEVTLTGLFMDPNGQVAEFATETTMTDADGAYTFTDVDFAMPGSAYTVDVEYDGMLFSNGALIEPGVTTMDLPIEVFERTGDREAVNISMMHVLIESSPESDGMVVTQMYVFDNVSNNVYFEDDGAGARVIIPTGAQSLSFRDGQVGGRFIVEGNIAYDRSYIQPGEGTHGVVVTYVVPSNALELPVMYGVEEVTVMTTGAEIRSDQLGQPEAQNQGGQDILIYAGEGIEAGSALAFEVRGAGPGFQLDWRNLVTAVAITVALLAVFLVIWQQRSGGKLTFQTAPARGPQNDAPSSPLVKQIADLDSAFEAGRISRLEYEEKRAALKLRLIEEN